MPLRRSVTFPNGTEVTAGGAAQGRVRRRWRHQRHEVPVQRGRHQPGQHGDRTTPAGGTVTDQRRRRHRRAASCTWRPMDATAELGGIRAVSSPSRPARRSPAWSIDARRSMPLSRRHGAAATRGGGDQTTSAPTASYSFTGFAPGDVHPRLAQFGGRCGLTGASGPADRRPGLGGTSTCCPLPARSGYTCRNADDTRSPPPTTVLGVDRRQRRRPRSRCRSRSRSTGRRTAAPGSTPTGLSPSPTRVVPTRTPAAPAVPLAIPNALVAPFWDDLVVDCLGERAHGEHGSGSRRRRFIIEWRNVHRKASTSPAALVRGRPRRRRHGDHQLHQLDNDAERGRQRRGRHRGTRRRGRPDLLARQPALADGRAIVFATPQRP